MQIKSFTYTKSSGEQSFRDVLVLQEPSNMLLAVDISELSQEDQAAYAVYMSKLHDEYTAKIAALNQEYDMLNRIHKFDPLKMTDVSSEYVG